MDNIDALIQVLELSARAQSAIRMPLNLSEAVKVGKNRYKKEILRVGELILDNQGRTFNFTSQFLKDAKTNFERGVLDYVPLIYADKETNAHTFSARPDDYAGVMESTELDDYENPTKMYGIFNLKDDASQMVEHNKKFGVSVTAHPNFVDEPRGQYVGPMILDVCATHKPKLTKMDGWDRVEVTASNNVERFDVIDLSDASFNVIENNDEGGSNMADTPELTDEMIQQLLESDAVKNAMEQQIKAAVAEKDAEIATLSNKVGDIQEKSWKQVVKAATNTYRQAGVPPVIVDAAEALMLSFDAKESDEVIKLSVVTGKDENDKAVTETLELSRVELLTKMLDETKGFVDLSSEQGSSEDEDDTVKLSGEARKNARNHLLSLTNQFIEN